MNELMSKIAGFSTNRIALFGLIITGLYFYTLYDSGASIVTENQGISGQITEETSKKVETEKILKKEEEMRSDVASLAKTYEEVKSKIPIEFESSELRTIVEQISNAAELKIDKLKNTDLQPETTSGPDANLVDRIAIEYTFEGNYSQILNFMSQVSQVEKVIKVSELKIKTTDGKDGPARQLMMEATVVGYKQAVDTAKKKPEEVK